jgi:hypothetical protein
MSDNKKIEYECGEPNSTQIKNLFEAIWQQYIENGFAAVLYYFGLYFSIIAFWSYTTELEFDFISILGVILIAKIFEKRMAEYRDEEKRRYNTKNICILLTVWIYYNLYITGLLWTLGFSQRILFFGAILLIALLFIRVVKAKSSDDFLNYLYIVFAITMVCIGPVGTIFFVIAFLTSLFAYKGSLMEQRTLNNKEELLECFTKMLPTHLYSREKYPSMLYPRRKGKQPFMLKGHEGILGEFGIVMVLSFLFTTSRPSMLPQAAVPLATIYEVVIFLLLQEIQAQNFLTYEGTMNRILSETNNELLGEEQYEEYR